MKKPVSKIYEDFSARYKLTEREAEVLFLATQKVSTAKGLAKYLNLSPNTIQNHLVNIFEKTGSKNKADLIRSVLKAVIEAYQSQEALIRAPVVIVVDDEEDICEIIKDFLSDKGCKVYCFTNSADVPDAIAAIRPDFVISDYQMPKMNGAELFREIRKLYWYSPGVIFVTGYSKELDLPTALNLGAVGYFEKPIQLQKLFELIMDRFIGDVKEKNRYLRIPVNTEAVIDGKKSALVRNLGYGGVYMTMPKSETVEFKSGNTITFEFGLGDVPEKIQSAGEIIWTRLKADNSQIEMGVRFEKMAEKDKEKLFEFIRTKRVLSFIPNSAKAGEL